MPDLSSQVTEFKRQFSIPAHLPTSHLLISLKTGHHYCLFCSLGSSWSVTCTSQVVIPWISSPAHFLRSIYKVQPFQANQTNCSIVSLRMLLLSYGLVWVMQHRSNLLRILEGASVPFSSFHLLILCCVLLLNGSNLPVFLSFQSAERLFYLLSSRKFGCLHGCLHGISPHHLLVFFNKHFFPVRKCLQSYFIIFF